MFVLKSVFMKKCMKKFMFMYLFVNMFECMFMPWLVYMDSGPLPYQIIQTFQTIFM